MQRKKDNEGREKRSRRRMNAVGEVNKKVISAWIVYCFCLGLKQLEFNFSFAFLPVKGSDGRDFV